MSLTISCGDDPDLQDFNASTIEAINLLRLRVESLMLAPTCDDLISDVFRVCEAAHSITTSMNIAYRERTNVPFAQPSPAVRRLRTPIATPSLSDMEGLLQ